jgi:hypothetical protein
LSLRSAYTFGAAAATPGAVQNSHPAIRTVIHTVIAARLCMLLASLEISRLPVRLTEICGCRPSAVLDHGRLVLANVLFPRPFHRPAECVCTGVSENESIVADVSLDREAEVEARGCRRQVFKSIDVSTPSILRQSQAF